MLKEWLMKMKQGRLVKQIFKWLFQAASKLPVRKKTIVFESFLGKQYSDNPKALYQYIKAHYPDYDLYWSMDRRYTHNFRVEGLHCLRRLGPKWLLTMARAAYWITNSRLPLWIPKPAHTHYVQTWHGTPLKKLALDMDDVHMPGVTTASYKADFVRETRKWDQLISPNAYSTAIFKRAFHFNKPVIESGYPRNDVLYTYGDDASVRKLKADLELPLDKKVILYAPTWRDNDYHETGKYKFSLNLDLERLRQQFSDDFVVVLRLHYLVAEQLDLTGYEGFVLDYSSHNDISDLYLASDVLLTDYSSVFFDYANLRRPILFFVYDMDYYRDTLRGFYFDLEQKAPGPLLKTTEDVIHQLHLINDGYYQLPASFEAFYSRFCYLEDGQASKRAATQILGPPNQKV